MQLHWSGATRYHDWFAKPRIAPRRMLSQAQQAGLIGSVDWVAVGPDDKREEVEHDESVLESLLDRSVRRGLSYRCAAGGAKPLPWQMNLLLFPFQKSLGQVRGYNILNLWFDAEAFPGPDGSDALAQAFQTIHTPDDTEFAFIHPYERWSELSDALGGRYGDPVTIGPMFSGVYWAIFLGREHLALFDGSRLRDLQSYKVAWTGDDGLFIRVSRDIADATSTAVEEEMFRLTGLFRSTRV